MAEAPFVIQVLLPSSGLSKKIAVNQGTMIRLVLFNVVEAVANSGTEIEDTINYNLRYYQEDQKNPVGKKGSKREKAGTPKTSTMKRERLRSILKKEKCNSVGMAEVAPQEDTFWLKKNKKLESYNFKNGVVLRLEKEADFNSTMSKLTEKKVETKNHRFVSDENDAVKFLTKGRFSRDKTAKEIVTTERTYVDSLHILITYFITPALEEQKITAGGLLNMFSKVKLIHSLHTEFLGEMEARLEANTTAELGDLFRKLMPFMKVYGDYCLNYQSNINELTELMAQDESLTSWVRNCEAKEEMTLNSIGAYLIVPVQRIPRYRLLFEELLKLTPKTHPDHIILIETLDVVNEVAAYVNNYKGNEKKMLEVRESLEGCPIPILKPGRRWVCQGTWKKISSRATQERMFFLFSDILLYALPKKKPYVYKGSIALDAATWIHELPESEVKFAIQIVAKPKTYTLVFEDEEEKQQISKILSDLLQEHATLHPTAELGKFGEIINQKAAKDFTAKSITAPSIPIY